MFNKIKKWLNLDKVKLNIYDISLLLLPIAVWFSYQPVMYFGDYSGMHIELSITLIYLVIFVLVNLPQIFKNGQKLIKNKAVIIMGAFVLLCAFSLFWTLNLARGILTLGIIGVLFISFLAILVNPKIKKLLPALTRIFIISSVAISIFAWLQMIGDVVGLSSNITLLCKGCVSTMFGFPRLTAFAIEPQFFGSLLLAPILILAWRFISNSSSNLEKIAFTFLVATMILTLSRGAIYALLIGLALIVIFAFVKHLLKNKSGFFYLAGLTVFGVFLALLTQGTVATLNSSVDETFWGSVSKSIHQLSLGIIDFRSSTPTKTETEDETAKPQFDGYVEKSTDERLTLSEMAIGAWSDNPKNIILGSGLGSAGYAMNKSYPELVGKTEIVQNEYIEILLELGLIGFALFIFVIIWLIIKLRHDGLFIAIIFAFLAQWLFFSGYPNALHIYLIIAVLYVCRSTTLPLKLPWGKIKK